MKACNHILWLFFIAVTFGSCSKDGDNCDPTDKESPCYAGPSGNGEKLLFVESKINGTVRSTHEYDDRNRATIVYTYGPDGVLELTTTYTYTNASGDFPAVIKGEAKKGDIAVEDYTFGSDGRPVSMVQTVSTDSDQVPIDHQYSYSKNKMMETIIPREESPGIYVNTYTYDDNGNLLSIEFTLNGQFVSTVEQGNFDDKIAVGFYGNPHAWKFPGANNHQTLKATSSILGVVTDQIWEYTYNNDGYPITAEVFDNGSDVLVESHTYRYKPAK